MSRVSDYFDIHGMILAQDCPQEEYAIYLQAYGESDKMAQEIWDSADEFERLSLNEPKPLTLKDFMHHIDGLREKR